MENHKTVLCRYYLSGSCQAGETCTFAHGEHELVTSSSYKTRMCVNYVNGGCPHGKLCLFAHGVEELRGNAPVTPSVVTQSFSEVTPNRSWVSVVGGTSERPSPTKDYTITLNDLQLFVINLGLMLTNFSLNEYYPPSLLTRMARQRFHGSSFDGWRLFLETNLLFSDMARGINSYTGEPISSVPLILQSVKIDYFSLLWSHLPPQLLETMVAPRIK